MAMQGTKIGVNVKVKLVVDKAANRVLFAEAGKDFVDFLFQIQELPLGVVSQWVKSLSDNSIGCVSNIRDSIENLPNNYMISSQKSALLNPEVRNCGLKFRVPLKQSASNSRTLYRCSWCSHRNSVVYDNPHAKCSVCEQKVSTTNSVDLFAPSDEAVVAYLDGEGGYVKGLVTYLVTDELTVMPLQLDSCFNLLKEYNIGRVGDIQEKVVTVGLDEVKKLLEAALRSKTALTDTFLPPQETMTNLRISTDPCPLRP